MSCVLLPVAGKKASFIIDRRVDCDKRIKFTRIAQRFLMTS